MFPMTIWVKRLLFANIAMFVTFQVVPQLTWYLTLYPPEVLFRPWTLVTYMFLHGGIFHVGFNMLMLFFFGPRLESRLGPKSFLWLYFVSGLGGAAFSLIFAREYPVIGASAAVYGVLVGFALFWPRERIYIWGVLPVEAWLLVTGAVFFSLLSGVAPSAGSNTMCVCTHILVRDDGCGEIHNPTSSRSRNAGRDSRAT